MNQRAVHFRIVLKGPRSSLKRSVVAKVRAALARSGLVGRLRIEPYEMHRERHTLVEGALSSARQLEQIVMGLAHGHWLFSLAPDHREATFDVRRTPLGKMEIAKKIGGGAPLGMKFKNRRPTGEIVPIDAPGRDPIVTRILWLKGLEAQNRRAYSRTIYIHGTAEEKPLSR